MEKRFIIGVDLGGTNLKVALLDLRLRIKDKCLLYTRNFFKKEELIKGISDSVIRLIQRKRINKKEILGVGVGLPGPVDAARGLVYFLPNIAGWENVRLKYALEKKIKLAVFLDNDVNLMSLAEVRLGAARGAKYALCLTLGTGVGGGIIIENNIYRGADNCAAEIGHLPINEQGPRCKCGGIACLEAYIGNDSISRQGKKAFRRAISLEELSALAKKGNSKALSIWNKVGEKLGVALAAAVNLLNPDCIVIGGGVANAGSFLFSAARKVVKNRAMPVQAGRVRILKAKLGNDAGLIGAAIMVKEAKASQRYR